MENRFNTPAMKRTSDWILSQEIPSDITIQVGDATFNLHKLPLASRCGYIRKQVSNGSKATHIDITGMPGGAKAFELVTKFCYGENFEITEDNVAMLRCAAEHLEMTDESKGANLVGRTEAYLEAVALMSLAGAVTVLRKSEELLPVAEEVDLVGRSVDAIAYITCSDSQFTMSLGTAAGSFNGVSVSKAVDDWWADELTSLRIDTFQRVLIAMKARGFKGIALGTLIMLYAQKSLRRLDIHGRDKKKMDPRQEHEKRVVLETIAHPSLSEAERKKVCKAMDCQKLSREACAHAAQNDRLPVQTVVQVLYHEQRRLREAPGTHAPSGASSFYGGESPTPSLPYKPTPSLLGRHARGGGAPDEVSRLQRENDELKMELLRLKMRLRDPTALPPTSVGAPQPSGRPPLPKKPGGGGGGFMNNVSKKLGKLNPFLRLDAVGGAKVRTKPPKDRRHSIGW
ncbi:BTB/POZ domain-containing protein [Dichanthelium oligosanthes]|uniref:BTB/POZ domain-containing protein n=1 Tax=Dichanthelium oligosanthes TaxID=888268 RepID=A0A1E5W678_9POAL|nr:BTB/POZ domain-containing protein [Dichanthelium oligosanthes]